MGMSDARSTGSVSGIGTTYDLTKKIEIDLGYTPEQLVCCSRFTGEYSVFFFGSC